MWNVCQEFLLLAFPLSSHSQLSVMSECDLRDKRLTISVREEVPHLVIWYIFKEFLSVCRWNRKLQLYKYRFYNLSALVYLFAHSRVRKISSLVPSLHSAIVFVLFFFFYYLTHSLIFLGWWIAFKVERSNLWEIFGGLKRILRIFNKFLFLSKPYQISQTNVRSVNNIAIFCSRINEIIKLLVVCWLFLAACYAVNQHKFFTHFSRWHIKKRVWNLSVAPLSRI